MKTLWHVLSLLLIVGTAYAGNERSDNEKGNGGMGFLCTDSAGEKTVEVLDMVQAKMWGAKIALEELDDEIEIAKRAIERLKQIDEYRYLMYTKAIDQFYNLSIDYDDYRFFTTNDYDNALIGVPTNCEPQLIVNQVPLKYRDFEENKNHIYRINTTLWKLLTPMQKAAIIIHEVVYNEMINYKGVKDANYPINLTANIISDSLDSMTQERWDKKLNQLQLFQAVKLKGGFINWQKKEIAPGIEYVMPGEIIIPAGAEVEVSDREIVKTSTAIFSRTIEGQDVQLGCKGAVFRNRNILTTTVCDDGNGVIRVDGTQGLSKLHYVDFFENGRVQTIKLRPLTAAGSRLETLNGPFDIKVNSDYKKGIYESVISYSSDGIARNFVIDEVVGFSIGGEKVFLKENLVLVDNKIRKGTLAKAKKLLADDGKKYRFKRGQALIFNENEEVVLNSIVTPRAEFEYIKIVKNNELYSFELCQISSNECRQIASGSEISSQVMREKIDLSKISYTEALNLYTGVPGMIMLVAGGVLTATVSPIIGVPIILVGGSLVTIMLRTELSWDMTKAAKMEQNLRIKKDVSRLLNSKKNHFSSTLSVAEIAKRLEKLNSQK